MWPVFYRGNRGFEKIAFLIVILNVPNIKMHIFRAKVCLLLRSLTITYMSGNVIMGFINMYKTVYPVKGK